MPSSDDRFEGLAGSQVYRAPEMLDWKYGPSADVWAAGVILYRLLGGVPPFHNACDETDHDTGDDTDGVTNDDNGKKYKQINFHSKPWDSISEDAKDLIRKMLEYRPYNREKPLDALCHRWLNVDGVHPTLAGETILFRLNRFSKMNKLKKMALWVIVDRLQRVEIAGLEAYFQEINTSKNGEITFEELKAGLKRDSFSSPLYKIHDIMEAADLNENGTIDCREFIAGTLPYYKMLTLELWLSAFEYFADESSGYITLEKLQQTCPNTSLVLLKDIIKEFGQEKDGCISYSEFVDMMQEFWRKPMHSNLDDINMKDAPGGSH